MLVNNKVCHSYVSFDLIKLFQMAEGFPIL
jgi:hypothetical protein